MSQTKTKSKTPKSLSKSEIYRRAERKHRPDARPRSPACSSRWSTWSARTSARAAPASSRLPGLLKIKVVRKPAIPARTGINPFTKQETMFKAKPARNVVKLQALKSLKALA